MNIHTTISGSKNKILREHRIDFTGTEILAIRVANDIFNEMIDDSIYDDDLVYFENGAMVMDDLRFVSSILNSIVDCIGINETDEDKEVNE